MNQIRKAHLKCISRFLIILLFSSIFMSFLYRGSIEILILFSFVLTGILLFFIEIMRHRHKITDKEERRLRKIHKWEQKHSSLQYEWIFSKGYGKKIEETHEK